MEEENFKGWRCLNPGGYLKRYINYLTSFCLAFLTVKHSASFNKDYKIVNGDRRMLGNSKVGVGISFYDAMLAGRVVVMVVHTSWKGRNVMDC